MYTEGISVIDWILIVMFAILIIISLVGAIGESWNKQKQKHLKGK